MYRIGLGLILPLMVPLFSYANEGAALPPLVDKPIKDPASFIQFALGDVCLPAAERNLSRKVEKRRAEILKFFAAPESRFTSVYSGDNQPGTALRDIYCADLSDMGATIVPITPAKPERITKNTSTVQISTKNYSRSCTEAS